MASAIATLAPAAISSKVMDEMLASIKHDLGQNKVDAEVLLVDPVGYQPAAVSSSPSIAIPIAIGVGAFGFAMIAYKMFFAPRGGVR